MWSGSRVGLFGGLTVPAARGRLVFLCGDGPPVPALATVGGGLGHRHPRVGGRRLHGVRVAHLEIHPVNKILLYRAGESNGRL